MYLLYMVGVDLARISVRDLVFVAAREIPPPGQPAAAEGGGSWPITADRPMGRWRRSREIPRRVRTGVPESQFPTVFIRFPACGETQSRMK